MSSQRRPVMHTSDRRGAPLSDANPGSHQRRRRLVSSLVLVVGLASALVSCTATPIAQSATFKAADIQALIPNLREHGFNEQADAFEDGQVTAEEYQNSIQQLRGCIESGGYGFSDPHLSPVTGLTYEFVFNSNGRDDAQAMEHFNSCQDRYITPLSTVFLSTHTQQMDPLLKSELLQCLESSSKPGNAAGINLVEIAPITQEDESLRKAARSCITQLVPELFPDLPSAAIYD